MTAVAENPTQLMLAGQAAAPEGPVDLAGMYLMHRAFRRSVGSTPLQYRARFATPSVSG